MRITRVGAKARAAVDCGPGGMSSRHGSGVQVQSGRELIQSSRALLQPNGQHIQSIQALALSSQAQVQSSQALVQSSQALVQSRGLLVKGSAGLQVRVAVIKRTRLDPLPSVGPLAAPTVINPATHSQSSSTVHIVCTRPHLCLLNSVRHGLECNITKQDVCRTSSDVIRALPNM